MKQYELIIEDSLSTFLTQVRENIRAGHYIQAFTKEKNVVGKVTYITSDYIYINKEKINIRNLEKVTRISKKVYGEMY